MAKPKLNQIIALTSGKKDNAHKVKSEVYQQFQKSAPLEGISRSYVPKDDDGDKFPDEKKHVQVKVKDGISKVREALVDLFDMVATQDWANTQAKADIVVDEITVLSGVPVTYLLFLEKQLVDLHTFVEKLPVLDPAKLWHYDQTVDCYATEPVQTVKTKKVMKNHVKAEATDKHPAQVDVYTEDVVIGRWTTSEFSGAIPAKERNEMLEKVRRLQDAVKCAREEANGMEVPVKMVGDSILKFVFGK